MLPRASTNLGERIQYVATIVSVHKTSGVDSAEKQTNWDFVESSAKRAGKYVCTSADPRQEQLLPCRGREVGLDPGHS